MHCASAMTKTPRSQEISAWSRLKDPAGDWKLDLPPATLSEPHSPLGFLMQTAQIGTWKTNTQGVARATRT